MGPRAGQQPWPPGVFGIRIRVVLVDDSAPFLEALGRIVGGDPRFEVVASVPSGAEAPGAVTETRPDLVLLDLVMPGTNGLETTRLIRTLATPTDRAPHPRIVILTLHDTPEYREAAFAAGADGFIGKSEFSLDRLHEMWFGFVTRRGGTVPNADRGDA